jgi:uncharacterized membrane protein
VAAAFVLPLNLHLSGIAFSCAVLGLFFDSWLGAVFERHGWLNNDAVNFLSTLVSALTAATLTAKL